MDKLYIICGGCRHYIKSDNSCKKQFELFPSGRIPDPVSGKTKKNEIPLCWES